MNITFKSIGTVSNEVALQKDCGWGNDCSSIIIDEEYRQGLLGLDGFSHIVVVFYLDQAKFDPAQHLVRRPHERADFPLMGILAQRSKDRPNPIGMTAVRLLDVSDSVVTVQGLDAINGTPVLDIKPYYPKYDCRTDATVPAWVDDLMKNYF